MKLDINGYVVEIASIARVDPDLYIVVCLEESRNGEIWFWTGFLSTLRQPIVKLRNLCPLNLSIVDTNEGYEREKISRYYYFNAKTMDKLQRRR
jgi:hypothetical protein